MHDRSINLDASGIAEEQQLNCVFHNRSGSPEHDLAAGPSAGPFARIEGDEVRVGDRQICQQNRPVAYRE